MTSKLLQQVTQLITDKDFQALTRRCVATSLFECISFDENKKSDTIAWLINPKEGHQQSDYFLRALVNFVFNQATDIQLEKMPSVVSMLQTNLSNAFVIREMAIGVNNTKKYIDLFLVDPVQQLVIVIERKDGSVAKNNQLLNYANWVEEHYKGWQQIFVLSDSYSKSHGEQYDSRYVQIDDTWLTDALLDLISREGISRYLKHQFRDIHDYIFGQWHEEHDSYYQDFNKILNRVANSHSDTLRKIENYSLSVQEKTFYLLDTTPKTYFAEVLPNSSHCDQEALVLMALVLQYNGVFEQLHGLNEFHEFETQLLSLNNQLSVEIYAEHISFTPQKYTNDESWPIAFELSRNTNEQDDTTYILNLYLKKLSDDTFHTLIEKVAQLYGRKFKINQKNIDIKRIGVFNSLDMSPASELAICLQSELKKVFALKK